VLVVALAVIAFLRVLILASAFPPFNNVDEVFHFDNVVKSAAGEFPVRLADAHLSVTTRETIAVYGTGVSMPKPGLILFHNSPEYMNPVLETGVPPPVWRGPPGLQAVAREHGQRHWDLVNYLAVDPPLYYAVAGGWYRLSDGLADGHRFYWTRALGALVAAALVWLTWWFARAFFPPDSLVRFGAPALVAFFPQDTAYGITSDVLAPLTFGFACFALLRFGGAVAGLAVAAALLTKPSTEAILLVAVLCVVTRPQRPVALIAGIVVPVGLWALRFALAGAPSAASQKIENFGWKAKSLVELGDHPVFTLAGAAAYFYQAIATFWRGELTWHKSILIHPALDGFYVISSLALLLVAVLRCRDRAVAASLVAFVGTAAWLVMLSIAFHFPSGVHQYPIKEGPFLSGRLLIVALVPFAIVYVAGLERLLGWIRLSRHGRALVVVLVAGVTIGEIALVRPVFGSAYNWFALLSR
jgi:hypothetical protein